MIKKLLYRKSIIAAAALATVLFSGCELLGLEEDEEKPEEPPATTDVSSGSGGIAAVNRVTATVSGIVRDGVGNPVEGVELSYSNGARSLFRCVTDKDGRYELYFHNESTDVGSSSLGRYQVTLTKDGYTMTTSWTLKFLQSRKSAMRTAVRSQAWKLLSSSTIRRL